MSSAKPNSDKDAPIKAWCDLHLLHLKLTDGREVATPLWWYPKLSKTTLAQRNNFELILDGVHLPELDEDLSIAGMFCGWKYPNAKEPLETAQ